MPLSDIALKTYYYRMLGTELDFLQPIFLNPLSAGVTDRQTECGQADRQTDRQTDRQSVDRLTDRQTDGQTDGRTHRQSDKQTNRHYEGVLGIIIQFEISLLQRRPDLKKPYI